MSAFSTPSHWFVTYLPFFLSGTVEEPHILTNPEKRGVLETKKEPRGFIKVKKFLGNTLPDNEKECINGFPNGFPRHPISNYYKEHLLHWTKETVDGLLKRNEILLKCDKEKAEQLILAEKQMFYSWNTAVIATGIFALLFFVMK